MKSRGVVYVVWGKKYIEEAAASARRVKLIDDLPCILITPHDSKIDESPFDQVITMDFEESYRDKIMMRISPFEETIFLDCDTYPSASLLPLFTLLQRFDIFYQAATGGRHYSIDDVPIESFPEPSAGVIGWRKNAKTEEFFDQWEKSYCEQVELLGADGAWDQRSMRAALWKTDVRLTALTGEWQVYTYAATILLDKVRLVHGRRHVMQTLQGADAIDDYRVYIPRVGSLPLHHITGHSYFIFSLKLMSISLRYTARSFLHHTRIWPKPTNKRQM